MELNGPFMPLLTISPEIFGQDRTKPSSSLEGAVDYSICSGNSVMLMLYVEIVDCVSITMEINSIANESFVFVR